VRALQRRETEHAPRAAQSVPRSSHRSCRTMNSDRHRAALVGRVRHGGQHPRACRQFPNHREALLGRRRSRQVVARLLTKAKHAHGESACTMSPLPGRTSVAHPQNLRSGRASGHCLRTVRGDQSASRRRNRAIAGSLRPASPKGRVGTVSSATRLSGPASFIRECPPRPAATTEPQLLSIYGAFSERTWCDSRRCTRIAATRRPSIATTSRSPPGKATRSPILATRPSFEKT
jgi:hypothetical protein